MKTTIHMTFCQILVLGFILSGHLFWPRCWLSRSCMFDFPPSGLKSTSLSETARFLHIERKPLWWVLIFPNSSWSHIQPRLYIHLILSCRESSFATVWATVCSSWVRINCFTSCRSILLPEGDCGKRYIEQANTMMSRILAYIIRVDWGFLYIFFTRLKTLVSLYIWKGVYITCQFLYHHIWFQNLWVNIDLSKVCSSTCPHRCMWWKFPLGATTL